MNEYEALVREYRIRDLPKLTRRDEIIRDLPEPKRFNMYHVVVGMRRSGKSFYLFQMISDLHKAGVDPDRIFYFDFSDDRLEPMSPTCGSDVIEEYYRQVPAAREQGAYLFLDEVQELGEWQGLLRRLSQNERVTLTVTGSSSKLSAGELGTKSRGRAHSHVLYPLSFAEFCRFSGRDELAKGAAAGEAVSRAEQTLLVGLYDRYLVEGGFPGVFGMPSADRIEVLQGYVRDVVAGSLRALALVSGSSESRETLRRNSSLFRELMTEAGFELLPGSHPIVPVMFPGDDGARRAAQIADHMLTEGGVYVIAFSFPVVPKGKARIRVQLSAAHSEEDVRRCVEAFVAARSALPATDAEG